MLSVLASFCACAMTARASMANATPGQMVTISVTANGTAPFSYQWYKNGAALAGATADTLVLSSVTNADAGNYTAVLRNAAGSSSSDTATVSVSSTVVAPSINAQPSSVSVALGQPASFSVVAGGTGPLSYQWRKNGAAVSGATSSTYTIASVSSTDAASYSVVVLNAAGTVISNGATLTISSGATGGATATSLWPNTAMPALVDAGADNSVELGVKFKSDVAGVVTGIRFYKGSANTGSHVGHLWSASGALLATATFTNESSSGWQQVTFSQPVSIAANTVYVASYHVNAGHYSASLDQFATSGVDAGSLHALASGVAGGNGVYTYGSGAVFPNSTYRNTNYWVDVLFKPAAAASAPTSVWTNAATPSVVDCGPDNSVELGMKFKADVAGTVTAIRFYKSSANTGTHVGSLWSSTGSLLATVTFSSETGSGWQQANFSAPVAIAANTVYVVSYHAGAGHYSANLDFFGSAGVDNGSLHALSSAVAGANGVYAYSTGTVFPNQSFRDANYWVDVVFQPAP